MRIACTRVGVLGSAAIKIFEESKRNIKDQFFTKTKG